jgi:putative transposase
MRHRLYYHVVWTTRERARLIDAGLAQFLCRFLRGVARQERAHILEIGMVATHVHVLMRADPLCSLSRLLQRLKGGSSAIAGKERHSTTGLNLKWSKGYSITTIGPRALEGIRAYLRSQPIRHPEDVIKDWPGDVPEYEIAGQEQWAGSDRSVFRR